SHRPATCTPHGVTATDLAGPGPPTPPATVVIVPLAAGGDALAAGTAATASTPAATAASAAPAQARRRATMVTTSSSPAQPPGPPEDNQARDQPGHPPQPHRDTCTTPQATLRFTPTNADEEVGLPTDHATSCQARRLRKRQRTRKHADRTRNSRPGQDATTSFLYPARR